MSEIKIIHNPTEEELNKMGVKKWGVWTKEKSEFPWHYSEKETCYFLEGDVLVTPETGDPVGMGAGDLVTFPQGMSCMWKVRKPVRKHYHFG